MKLFTFLSALLIVLLPAQHVFKDVVYDVKSNSSLKIESPFGGAPPRGYYPIKITVENNDTRAISWDFETLSHDTYSFSLSRGNRLSSRYNLTCPPKEVVEMNILVPMVTVMDSNSYNDHVTFKIEADETSGRYSYEQERQTGLNGRLPALLMSESLHRKNGSALSNESSKVFSSSRRVDFQSQFIPSELPSDWRAYTGYDLIMLTTDDWSKTPTGAQQAIQSWTKMGGELVVYKSPGSLSLDELGMPAAGTYGWGLVKTYSIDKRLNLDAKKTLSWLAPKARERSRLAIHDVQTEYATKWALKDKFGDKPFSLVSLVVILILFAILVGPINLFVLAKEGRRHRLFITTPIISLVTTVILFIVILLQDGTGGRGMQQSLIEIDAQNNTLYGAQEQIARTGMLLKSQFELNSQAVIDPLMLDNSSWARVKKKNDGGKCQYSARIESASKTSYAGDWFLSRTESAHMIQYQQPFRQGVSVKSESGGLQVTSSLECPLGEFYYVAQDGSYWSSNDVKQGIPKSLTKSNKAQFDRWLKKVKMPLGGRNRDRLTESSRQKARFYATCSNWDGIETHSSIEWTKKDALLCGSIEEH